MRISEITPFRFNNFNFRADYKKSDSSKIVDFDTFKRQNPMKLPDPDPIQTLYGKRNCAVSIIIPMNYFIPFVLDVTPFLSKYLKQDENIDPDFLEDFTKIHTEFAHEIERDCLMYSGINDDGTPVPQENLNKNESQTLIQKVMNRLKRFGDFPSIKSKNDTMDKIYAQERERIIDNRLKRTAELLGDDTVQDIARIATELTLILFDLCKTDDGYDFSSDIKKKKEIARTAQQLNDLYGGDVDIIFEVKKLIKNSDGSFDIDLLADVLDCIEDFDGQVTVEYAIALVKNRKQR